MTPKDGVYLIKEIRKLDKEIPVFIITGYGTIDFEDNAEELNVSKILKKPFEADDVKEALAEVFPGEF